MKFTLSLTGIASLLRLASAKCYPHGAPFPDSHSGVIRAISSASSYYNNYGGFDFDEKPWQQAVDDKCLKFILQNISKEENRTIAYDDALDGFTKEYHGCENGGDTSYTNWRYVLDPNEDCVELW